VNRLQLVQRLHLECRMSGSRPLTTVSTTGQTERLVSWIDTAWQDLQTLHMNWGWKRASCSFTTTEGRTSYTAAQCGVTDLGEWIPDSFRSYNTAAGINSETPIFAMPGGYDDWRDTYLLGSNRSTYSQPIQLAVTPDKSLAFGPITDDGYTIVGDYFRAPTAMDEDGDEPTGLPAEYRMLIVYMAMLDYGAAEVAIEVLTRGEKKRKSLLKRLEMLYLPQLQWGGPLC
jgi:hypothetical protein